MRSLALGAFLPLLCLSCSDQAEPVQPVVVLSNEPPAEVARSCQAHTDPPAVPEGAKKLNFHWKLKLPWPRKSPGDHVFSEESAFMEMLTANSTPKRAKLYKKWNGLDFEKQMVLMVVREHTSGGYGNKIESVWKTPTEIVIIVAATHPCGPDISVTQAFTWPNSAVAVNRSELPVRFEWYYPPEEVEANQTQPAERKKPELVHTTASGRPN